MWIKVHFRDMSSDRFVIIVLCSLAWICCCRCSLPGAGRRCSLLFTTLF